MSEERLTKRAWRTDEDGRRRRGRPKLRCRDNVRRDLEKAGVNSQVWERVAKDWDRWGDFSRGLKIFQ